MSAWQCYALPGGTVNTSRLLDERSKNIITIKEKHISAFLTGNASCFYINFLCKLTLGDSSHMKKN